MNVLHKILLILIFGISQNVYSYEPIIDTVKKFIKDKAMACCCLEYSEYLCSEIKTNISQEEIKCICNKRKSIDNRKITINKIRKICSSQSKALVECELKLESTGRQICFPISYLLVKENGEWKIANPFSELPCTLQKSNSYLISDIKEEINNRIESNSQLLSSNEILKSAIVQIGLIKEIKSGLFGTTVSVVFQVNDKKNKPETHIKHLPFIFTQDRNRIITATIDYSYFPDIKTNDSDFKKLF